jgi:aldehyde dehydrogenase (NAD+)
MSTLITQLQGMRNYFLNGATRSLEFRKKQLQALKKVILDHEKEIEKALYQDLKKSAEETYATETGLLLAEINVTLKNLREWMQPRVAGTDMVNLPSGSKIFRDPLGVVLIIAPWNYPLQLLLIPLVGAIAGGNCSVLKPSELAPATSAIIEKMVSEIFPSDYVKVVMGDGAEVVPPMMKNFRFDHVFYTGSIPVGKSIYQLAAEQLTPVTLELGGKSPAIVHSDANLSIAARRIILGKFINTGQTCIAPDYVLVHEAVKERFINKLKETITKFYTDDPSSSNDYGKIINEKRFDKLVSYLSQGKIVFGGQHNRSELYIAPTVLEDVSLDAALMKEEIFGPLLPIISYDNTEEAMKIVQRNSGPLALYLFTDSKRIETEWIEKISFGGGCINNTDWHFTNYYLPFGGVGNSGIGAYHGKYTFDTFTRAKPIMKTPTWFDPSIKYPPFKGKLGLFKKIIR